MPISELVKARSYRQNLEVAFFINVTITVYTFWTLYAFTAFGVILVAFAELSEAFRDGYKYFTYASNWLDFGNLFCAGLCLILTLGSAIKNLGLFSKSHGDLRIEKMDF